MNRRHDIDEITTSIQRSAEQDAQRRRHREFLDLARSAQRRRDPEADARGESAKTLSLQGLKESRMALNVGLARMALVAIAEFGW